MGQLVELSQYQGQVLRLVGKVDSFGSYPSSEGLVYSICLKDLRLADNHQPTNPDHAWFPLRQELAELHLQPGDEILFTTRIHRLHKGFQATGNHTVPLKQSPQRITYGPARAIKDITVLKRHKVLTPPSTQLRRLEAQLAITDQEKAYLTQAVNTLDAQLQESQNQKAELLKTVTHLDTQLKDYQTQKVDWQETVSALNAQIKAHQAQEADFTETLSSLSAKLKGYQSQVVQLQSQLTQQTHQQLEVVAHLQHQLNTSTPQQRCLSLVSVFAVISLMAGFGMGMSSSRVTSR